MTNEQAAYELRGILKHAALQRHIDALTRFKQARSETAPAQHAKWQCAARFGSEVDPPYANCGWPLCTCDPVAVKVVQALEEFGMFAPEPAPPQPVTEEEADQAAEVFINTSSSVIESMHAALEDFLQRRAGR